MASVDPQDLVLRRTTSATSDYDTSSLSDTIRCVASSKLSSYDSTLTLVGNEAKKPAEEDLNKQSPCAAALEELHRAASNRRAQVRRGSRFWLSPTSFNISAWKDDFQSHPNAEQEAARWCADILAMRLPMCSARSSTYTELLVSHYSHLFACSQNWCTCNGAHLRGIRENRNLEPAVHPWIDASWGRQDILGLNLRETQHCGAEGLSLELTEMDPQQLACTPFWCSFATVPKLARLKLSVLGYVVTIEKANFVTFWDILEAIRTVARKNVPLTLSEFSKKVYPLVLMLQDSHIVLMQLKAVTRCLQELRCDAQDFPPKMRSFSQPIDALPDCPKTIRRVIALALEYIEAYCKDQTSEVNTEELFRNMCLYVDMRNGEERVTVEELLYWASIAHKGIVRMPWFRFANELCKTRATIEKLKFLGLRVEGGSKEIVIGADGIEAPEDFSVITCWGPLGLYDNVPLIVDLSRDMWYGAKKIVNAVRLTTRYRDVGPSKPGRSQVDAKRFKE